MIEDFKVLIREIYGDEKPIVLHRPVFSGSERQDLVECIDSNFVSSVGAKVAEFEGLIADFVGSSYGIAVVNGTNALQVALRIVGVEREHEVITQPLTFVATCNAISYLGARPVFVDVDRSTLGISPAALMKFLEKWGERREGVCFNRYSGRRLAACLPMHTFGHPSQIDEISRICAEWGITLVEDAAESLGSFYKGKHTGTFGQIGVFSFNGNKIITTGGGGMIVTDNPELGSRAKHLTTTAKSPHPYEFWHDAVGYNFRMPNLNAALGCAQIQQLDGFLAAKRQVAERYSSFCKDHGVEFVTEPAGARSNYWLNAIILGSKRERDDLLEVTNSAGIMTRPIWRLMIDLPMYSDCQHDGLPMSRWLEDRVVCLPSSVP